MLDLLRRRRLGPFFWTQFTVAAAVLAIGLLRAGTTIPQLVLLLALLNGVGALPVRGVRS